VNHDGNTGLEYASLRADEEERIASMMTECFSVPETHWASFRGFVGIENFRVLRRAGEAIAGLGIYPFGQWFGGRRIPMAGISAVTVPPGERGKGIARLLMENALRESREAGVPLSALYASTQHLYRKVGFELAGTRIEYSIPTHEVASVMAEEIGVHSVPLSEHHRFHDVYRRFASARNGFLDRSAGYWNRLVHRREQELVFAYAFGREEAPDAYVVYQQKRIEGSHGYVIAIRDWAATTPTSYRRVLSFLLGLRSLGRSITWSGAPMDPLLAGLEEMDAEVTSLDRWMLRIVDVGAALAQRGYPAGAQGELHLRVTDPLFTENTGSFVLEVRDGRASVAAGGRGDLHCPILGLAPLYSGFMSPAVLRDIGWIEGDDRSLATAAVLFAGESPWLADMF
jgi:predicted acetyltransferase